MTVHQSLPPNKGGGRRRNGRYPRRFSARGAVLRSTRIVQYAGPQVKHLSKVFIIDEDPAVRASLDSIFTVQGYNVRCFQSAEAFLAQHHPTQVGCVLVDLSAPLMGGSELLRQLQESGSLLSVIITSGLIEAAALGKDAKASVPLLIKPYEVSTLLTMVEDGIAGSVRRRAKRK
jgi:FixJ family two-component response regulator